MRHAPRLVERVEDHLSELADVDHACHPLPQRLHRLHELESLGEEEGEDALLHLRLQRLEEDEDDERGDERVEEEEARALAAGPADEQPVDGGEDEADAGEDDDLAEQLVEIEEPVALDGLREEVQVDGHRHVGEGRRRPAGDADE